MLAQGDPETGSLFFIFIYYESKEANNDRTLE